MLHNEREYIENKLLDNGFESADIVVFDDPSYSSALIGVTNFNQAVYDYDLMIEYLMREENMDEEEAADFISYNSSFYYGNEYPLILFKLKE